jgi:hypothetical protein
VQKLAYLRLSKKKKKKTISKILDNVIASISRDNNLKNLAKNIKIKKREKEIESQMRLPWWWRLTCPRSQETRPDWQRRDITCSLRVETLPSAEGAKKLVEREALGDELRLGFMVHQMLGYANMGWGSAKLEVAMATPIALACSVGKRER